MDPGDKDIEASLRDPVTFGALHFMKRIHPPSSCMGCSPFMTKYAKVGDGITVISGTGSPDLMDMALRAIPFGRIISLACDCAGRQMSARLLRKCVMAFLLFARDDCSGIARNRTFYEER